VILHAQILCVNEGDFRDHGFDFGALGAEFFFHIKGNFHESAALPAFWMVAVNVFFLAWESPE
jgi:hypothetical protein